MNPMQGMARQMEWVARNTAHNLSFIPADKLNWRPAPTAKSALEVINHVVGYIKAMTPVLGGGAFTPSHTAPATNLQAAQELLITTAREYADALERLTVADLSRTIDLPFGSFPLSQAASMPVVDLIHHHGQIAYIQTLLGDAEDHFLMG
jgi:uncharacterized damage-inducible protein DinB